MINNLQIIGFSLGYLLILFSIAYMGDRLHENIIKKIKPIVVGLAVTIYCSAWSFYGTTAQAVDNGWHFPPTFLGTIILLIFFAPFLRRLISQSKHANITSIADYLAVSYGRSRSLAVLITIVSVAVLIPYISLQLKAITDSYHMLSDISAAETRISSHFAFDTAFYVAVMLGIFALAFGTRHLDSREHHNGLMLAIAFEAIVKLMAFVILTLFVTTSMFNGIEDIFIKIAQQDTLSSFIKQRSSNGNGYITALVLGFIATICLPRQFHVMVVESESSRDFETLRWLFSGYLIIFGLCMIPLAYAGLVMFQGQEISSGAFVQGLSIVSGREDLALLTYIGGLSAGSSMVIVACVAMATMACNELVVPLLLKTHWFNVHQKKDVSQLLRTIRRAIILVLMLLAYIYYRLLTTNSALGTIGLLSFALVAQFAPCLFCSLLLKPPQCANLSTAAVAGLTVGFILWCYTLLLPSMINAGLYDRALLDNGLFSIAWLRPNALFGLENLSELSHGVLWSLLGNICIFLYFLKNPHAVFEESLVSTTGRLALADLRSLLVRFLGTVQAELVFKQYPKLNTIDTFASDEDIYTVENILSGVIGSVSARYVIEHAYSSEENNETLEKTSEIFQFGRDLLQESIDNISQGISVLGSQLLLVAWNRSYLEIFNYPDGMVHVGRHISDLIAFNAQRNNLTGEQAQEFVDKRVRLMAQGSAYSHKYTNYNGQILEIQGAPMAGGGFVSTFTDITDYQNTLNILEETRATLEEKVIERTQELQDVNEKLSQANKNKTHFLAAAGHDLLQPLSAAKLFLAALSQRRYDDDTQDVLKHLKLSLNSADSIISELLAIAKLDSGEMRVNPHTFCIGNLLVNLRREFSVIAQNKGIALHCCYSSLNIHCDERLLKRVLQNLLSNAIRYTDQGKVLIGCRRRRNKIYIEVWDSGCGIPKHEKKSIFVEFHRLDKTRNDGGLGLGLATVQRVCSLLNIKLELTSEVGRGSMFRLILPNKWHHQVRPPEDKDKTFPLTHFFSTKVLCIDNEQAILDGMKLLLEPWNCAFHGQRALDYNVPWIPDIILIDYHLDNDVYGIAVVAKLLEYFSKQSLSKGATAKEIPVVVISADQNNDVQKQARDSGYFFLKKPLQVAELRSLFLQLGLR